MRLLAGVAVLLCLVVAGCSFGEQTESRSATATETGTGTEADGCRTTGLVTEAQGGGFGPGPPPIYWDEPTGGMEREFDSIEAAADELPFLPLTPTGIEPCEILVSGGPTPFLVMRFQDPQLGIFNVSQHKLAVPVAKVERQQRALPNSCPRQPGCAGVYSLTRLADGRDGLLVLGRGAELATHNLSFVDRGRGIEVVIQGPPHTFQAEEALMVANAFLAVDAPESEARADRFAAPPRIAKPCSGEQRESTFAVLCPTRLPGVTRGAAVEPGVKLNVRRWPRTGRSWYGISFNAPLDRPRFLHLELLGGEWNGERRAWSMRAWLGHSKRRIGRAKLGGQRGILYEHVPQGPAVFKGHLTFIWKRGEITYVASLHTWKPRRETKQMLGRIVRGLRPTPTP